MDIIYRIKFHLRMKIHSVKNWWEETILRKTDEEIFAEFNAITESLSQEEKDEIEYLVKVHDPLGVMLTEVLPKAWLQCSERGIWFAKDKIPPYLLEAWEQ